MMLIKKKNSTAMWPEILNLWGSDNKAKYVIKRYSSGIYSLSFTNRCIFPLCGDKKKIIIG